MGRLYDTMHIGGKDVYIVDAHHFALFPWAKVRRSLGLAPTLITLDHHTDTMEAFRGHCCFATNGDFDLAETMVSDLTGAIDWQSDDTLESTVALLRHDEHIHAAYLSGVISVAFAINLNDQTPSIEEERFHESISERWNQQRAGHTFEPEPVRPNPPYTYSRPNDGMFNISTICSIDCAKLTHDDDCAIARDHQVLESLYLDHEIATANNMAKCVGMASVEAAPYILDIDLDYFHSEESINPQNPDTFYRLIRNAVAITVAREPDCVEELRHEDSKITAESLLEQLVKHIGMATA